MAGRPAGFRRNHAILHLNAVVLQRLAKPRLDRSADHRIEPLDTSRKLNCRLDQVVRDRKVQPEYQRLAAIAATKA